MCALNPQLVAKQSRSFLILKRVFNFSICFVAASGLFFVPVVKIRLFVGDDGFRELVEVVIIACSEFQCLILSMVDFCALDNAEAHPGAAVLPYAINGPGARSPVAPDTHKLQDVDHSAAGELLPLVRGSAMNVSEECGRFYIAGTEAFQPAKTASHPGNGRTGVAISPAE
jgi:hypothetical protein